MDAQALVDDSRERRKWVHGRYCELETREGLAEGQVADDVEGHKVEPGRKVDCLSGILVNPLHEQADVLPDDGLLLSQKPVRERGCHDTAMAGVLLVVFQPEETEWAKNSFSLLGHTGGWEQGAPSGPVAVDVPPGVGGDIAQLRRRNLDDGSIFGMQVDELVVDGAFHLLNDFWNLGSTV